MAIPTSSSREDDDDAMADINVTPFIDVMLVLLIVFMIAAPLSTVDVPLNLPTSSAEATQRPEDPVWLSLAPDLTLTLGNQPLSGDDLQTALDAQTKGKRDVQVFLRADRVVPYGDLMTVLDQMRAAGYLKVALVGLQSTSEPQVPQGTP
ncbi:MAG: TonB system transport protein ExbD [Cypionkella sp.]|uniref:TonB system transport protein ExbD n=1 Tax=Cypionkella sp. TaxID=2811411 RepID=UPI002ABA5490|nr:TonB system transport protein ExbD [Cypionkella sp.]MDZ4309001.1 TonB system transport protein ExbD [Cypionkella sp.]MDZ4392014.1 TonB system transport protein ExbD [Cypionkella sp.]